MVFGLDGAALIIRFSSPDYAHIIFQALEPEAHTMYSNRSSVKAKLERGIIILDFKAGDTSALRATMNSYLRLCILVEKICLEVDQ